MIMILIISEELVPFLMKPKNVLILRPTLFEHYSSSQRKMRTITKMNSLIIIFHGTDLN